MTKPTQPSRWTRLSVISPSLVFLLSAAVAFAASPLGAQAPLDGPLFYQAELTGDSVVPPVASDGSGAFAGEGEERGSEIRFTLTASASGITQAHIHLGGPDENGDVAAFLFGLSDPPVNDVNIDGVLTETDLLGSVAGDWDSFVEAIFAGAYVQVHTIDNPAGELRGQIVVALPATTVDPDEGEDVPGPQPISLDAFLEAVVAAGFGPLQLQEIAVTQPWIPVPGAGILILDGAQAEVYSLSAVQAEQAIGNISGEASAFQPPANAAVWRSLELIVILRDAPSNSPVAAALFNILGSPVLATITGGGPPPPSGGDDGAVPDPDTGEESVDRPVALPNTGTGGLAEDGPGSGLALSLLATGIAVTALLAGLSLWRRRLT
ncbi:MAG: CHRD domain-containing protein [Chloroflexi bacterium]|nr:CHRD domain-containing protein [Chloroflexota bacterium]